MKKESLMLTTLFLGIAIFFPAQAHAQSAAALCRLLPKVQQGQGESIFAGAAYVPGVDVHGKPVAPADLETPPSDSAFSGVVRIPVTLDLAAALAQPLPQGTEIKAPVAMIEIHRDGRVLMNGTDITEKAYILCSGDQNVLIKSATETPEEIMIRDEGQKE